MRIRILKALGRLRVMKPNLVRRAAVELLQRTPVAIQQLHHLALAELSVADEPELHLRVARDPHGIVAVAFGDILTLLRATAALRGEDPPATRVRLSYSDLDLEQSALPVYFSNALWAEDRRDLRLDALPVGTLVIDGAQDGRTFSLEHLEAHRQRLGAARAALRGPFGYEPPRYRSTRWTRSRAGSSRRSPRCTRSRRK